MYKKYRAFLLLCFLFVSKVASAEHYAVIVHPDNPLNGSDTLIREELKQVYLGWKPRWDNHVLAQAIGRPKSSPEKQAFLREVLSMSAQEDEKHWNRAIVIHDLRPPRAVESDRAVVAIVSRELGAFSVVALSIAQKNPTKVKILLILGD